MPRVLVIDSYDSFVYNLVQYLGELGAEPVVVRNDQLTVAEALALAPAAVLLSPGPGRPEDAGIICAAIPAFGAAGHGASIGMAGFVAPGTFVLALVFLTSFILYYFVNWKYLSTVWPLS